MVFSSTTDLHVTELSSESTTTSQLVMFSGRSLGSHFSHWIVGKDFTVWQVKSSKEIHVVLKRNIHKLSWSSSEFYLQMRDGNRTISTWIIDATKSVNFYKFHKEIIRTKAFCKLLKTLPNTLDSCSLLYLSSKNMAAPGFSFVPTPAICTLAGRFSFCIQEKRLSLAHVGIK